MPGGGLWGAGLVAKGDGCKDIGHLEEAMRFEGEFERPLSDAGKILVGRGPATSADCGVHEYANGE